MPTASALETPLPLPPHSMATHGPARGGPASTTPQLAAAAAVPTRQLPLKATQKLAGALGRPRLEALLQAWGIQEAQPGLRVASAADYATALHTWVKAWAIPRLVARSLRSAAGDSSNVLSGVLSGCPLMWSEAAQRRDGALFRLFGQLRWDARGWGGQDAWAYLT